VVDQADHRNGLEALSRTLPAVTKSVKVLLLARASTDGQWWQELRREVGRQRRTNVLQAAEHLTLEPLALEHRAQAQLFEKAVNELAFRLGVSVARPIRPGTTIPATTSMQTIQAAALVAVLRQERGDDEPVDVDQTVWKELLDHEETVWKAADEREGLNLVPDTRRKAVVCAALLGARDAASATKLLENVADLRDAGRERRHRVAHWLHSMYPGRSPEWIAPMEPAFLTDLLVITELADDRNLADRLLERIPQDRMARVLTVLGSSSTRQPWARAQLERILAAQADVALRVACRITSSALDLDAAIAACVDNATVRIGDAALEALWRALPDAGHTVRLSRTVVAVARRRCHPPTDHDTPEGLRKLRDLARACRFAGDYASAVRHAKQAGDPAELAYALCWSGCADEALKPASEAVEKDALVLALRWSGDYNGALDLARQNVALHRRTIDSEADTGALAAALAELAQVLRQEGRVEEAVAAAQEAVQLLRPLAAADPDGYDRWVAVALASLGQAQRFAGRADEAVDAAQEAVDLMRAMAARFPAAHHRWLANALSGLCRALLEAGRSNEGVTAAAEAVRLLEPLVGADSRAHASLYGDALNDLGSALVDAGRGMEAASAAEKATKLYEELARHDSTHNRWLADSLGRLSRIRLAASDVSGAVAAARKAVDLLVPLAAEDPDAHQRWLAARQHNLSAALLADGNTAAARQAARDAVATLTALTTRNADPIYRQDLTRAKQWLSTFGADVPEILGGGR
jgi:tetratricopeptide (TPR) repeat protein